MKAQECVHFEIRPASFKVAWRHEQNRGMRVLNPTFDCVQEFLAHTQAYGRKPSVEAAEPQLVGDRFRDRRVLGGIGKKRVLHASDLDMNDDSRDRTKFRSTPRKAEGMTGERTKVREGQPRVRGR